MLLSSKDGKLCLLISDTAITTIQKEIAKWHPKETGGILIGQYDTHFRLATVKIATKPPKDSVHNTHAFNRGVKGIHQLLELHKKQDKSFYIGEWHTHPNNEPNASLTDLWQMNKFACEKLYGAVSPLLLIVGGNLTTGLKWKASIHKKWRRPIFLSKLN